MSQTPLSPAVSPLVAEPVDTVIPRGAPDAAKRRRSRGCLWGGAAGVILVVGAALLGRWLLARPPQVEVRLQVAERSPLDLVVHATTTGRVLSLRRVIISAELPARVIRRHFEVGDRVEQGEVVLDLDTAEYQARRDAANARHDFHAANLARLKQRRARDPASVSDQEWDAAIEQEALAGAELTLAETNLKKTRVAAPFAGILAKIWVNQGDFSTGARVDDGVTVQTFADGRLFEIFDDQTLEVSATVDEVDVPRLRQGQRVRLRPESRRDGKPVLGTLRLISPIIERRGERNREQELRVSIPAEAMRHFRPGMSCDTEIILDTIPDLLLVPSHAVQGKPEEPKYLFVAQEERAVKRAVRIGRSNFTATEIVDGLQVGETVVIPWKMQAIADGSPLIVRE